MCGGDKEMKGFAGETCPECGGEMCPYHHYYVTDKKTLKLIEICKKCYRKRQVRRMCVRVKGKTIVID